MVDYRRAFFELMDEGGYRQLEGWLEEASRANRGDVDCSGNCGCYSCGRVFNARYATELSEDRSSYLCPSCGARTLLPDILGGYSVTEDFLGALAEYREGLGERWERWEERDPVADAVDDMLSSPVLARAVEAALEAATTRNRALVEESGTCLCYGCLRAFPAAEAQWVDGGQTAACPRCGCESVVPDAAGLPMTGAFWSAQYAHSMTGEHPADAGVALPARSLVASCKAPVCYHGPNELLRANLGYAQGVAADGTPFEAELWLDGDDLWATFVLPDKGWEDSDIGAPVVPCAAPSEVRWASHLALGMVEHMKGERCPDLVRYVDWAEEQGLVGFCSQGRAGVAHALIDVDGTDCVAIDVGLRVDGEELGSLSFELRPFPGQSRGKVVDLATRRGR